MAETSGSVGPNTPIELVRAAYERYPQRTEIARRRLGRSLTFAEKILIAHADDPETVGLDRGRDYGDYRPDRVAMQDATAQMALLQFTLAGLPTVAAPSTVHCDHLSQARVGADAEVLRVVRLNLADGEPFALVTVWLPESLGAHVSRADVERATFYDLLPLHGVETGRIVQTITATAADRTEARRLGGRSGDPLLACRRVTYDRSGAAVMVSEHRYPARSTALEVEFPAPHRTGVSHG